MKTFEIAFFVVSSLLVLFGGVVTVGARNPIRGAMGLLTTIVGIAGHYLLLTAELLAAVQVLVYAGAVVVLFLFVIMLLGPSATSPRDARGAVARYAGAGLLLAAALVTLFKLVRIEGPRATALPAPRAGFGTIEAVGREMFTTGVVPFEISGALLLVAVVGAIAVARGRQVDPTTLRKGSAPAVAGAADPPPPPRAAGAAEEVAR